MSEEITITCLRCGSVLLYNNQPHSMKIFDVCHSCFAGSELAHENPRNEDTYLVRERNSYGR